MTGNKEREFIAGRQLALQNFMIFITTHANLRHSLTLKMFLNPLAYSANLEGIYYLKKIAYQNTQQSIVLYQMFLDL